MPKERYVLHYRNLQLYLELGQYEDNQGAQDLEFYQFPWMAPHIAKNTQLRTAAKDDFEKDFFKLMNNAGFGKTMKNNIKRVNGTQRWDLAVFGRPAKYVCPVISCHGS